MSLWSGNETEPGLHLFVCERHLQGGYDAPVQSSDMTNGGCTDEYIIVVGIGTV